MANGAAGRGAHQLPPGRHGLSRSYVARNQRDRIVAAVAESALECGYGRMSVEDIVKRAGVSRRTFYEQFSSKDEAFLETFDHVAKLFISGVRKAVSEQDTFAGRIVAGFGTFLGLLAASPAFAHMCIVEVLAAGPEAIERRSEVMREFARIIDSNAEILPRRPKLPAMTADAIVGGIYEAIFRRIAAGQADQLMDMLPDVVELCLMPYIGEEKASATAQALRDKKDPVGAVATTLADEVPPGPLPVLAERPVVPAAVAGLSPDTLGPPAADSIAVAETLVSPDLPTAG